MIFTLSNYPIKPVTYIKSKMSYHLSVFQNKAELGLDQHDDSLDEEEYERHATFHRECRAEPKLMPYVKVEGEHTVYDLRHKLSSLLRWRDANPHMTDSFKEKPIWNLVLARIDVIKKLIY